MADIINLRRTRKIKAREAKECVAAENRLKFGRPKAERQLQTALEKQAAKQLDSHKRDTN
jgi:Domain of unknown function (DUF4169)